MHRERESDKEKESIKERQSHTERERERQRERGGGVSGGLDRDRQRNRERHTETETESFTAVFCCECSAVYPGLLPAIRRAQATSGLEKKTHSHCTALPNTCLIVISGLGGSQFMCNLRVAAI